VFTCGMLLLRSQQCEVTEGRTERFNLYAEYVSMNIILLLLVCSIQHMLTDLLCLFLKNL